MQNVKSKIQGFLSKESNRSLALAGAVTVGVLGIVGVIATKDKVVTINPFGSEIELNCTKKTYMEAGHDLYSVHRTAEGHVDYVASVYGDDSLEKWGASAGVVIIESLLEDYCD